jgi:hypothetical protein
MSDVLHDEWDRAYEEGKKAGIRMAIRALESLLEGNK